LLKAGKRAVAPARIIIVLKAERQGRTLCVRTCRTQDGGEEENPSYPFRSQNFIPLVYVRRRRGQTSSTGRLCDPPVKAAFASSGLLTSLSKKRTNAGTMQARGKCSIDQQSIEGSK
jgi:hypothetical protein